MIEDTDLQARSDQMNAVDFVQPITFTVEHVVYKPKTDQPVHVHMAGYPGRPYKPCKGMLRGLSNSQCWGKDEQQWVGKKITLFCDPSVKWAGAATGGIRISAVSGIKEPFQFTVALNKSQRYIHTFNVIAEDARTKKEFVLTHWQQDIEQSESNSQLDTIVQQVKAEFGNDSLLKIKDAVTEARHRVSAAEMEEQKEPPELEGNPY
jgi:hypothetical protein